MKQVFILFISIFCLICFSCKHDEASSPGSDDLARFKDKATTLLNSNPDYALQYVDSAFRIITAFDVEDTVKTAWLQLKADVFMSLGHKDSAYNAILQARDESIISMNTAVQAYCDLLLAQELIDDGKYLMARKYVTEGFELYKKTGDDYHIARAYNLLGTLLSYQGNYHEAQEHLIEASAIFEKLTMSKALGAVFNNIATNYQATNDNVKALDYFRKSLALSLKSHDTLNYISTLNNLSVYYRSLMPDSAEFYLMEALKYESIPMVEYSILSVKFNLANLYFDKREYDKAREYYDEIHRVCLAKGIFNGIANSYNGIGNIFEARNEDAQALDYYKKAYRIADSLGETPSAMVFLSNVQYIHEKTGNTREALALYKKITAINDSLLSLEKQIAIHDLEMLYNKEKTDRENESLNNKVLIQKNHIRTKNIILGIVLLTLGGLGVLLWNIYLLYKQRDEAYNTLIKKYREDLLIQASVNSANEEIVPVTGPGVISDDEQFNAIIHYFETEKPYLNARLKIEDIATSLNIPQKTIVTLLQRNLETHFKAFVNSFRVNEAKRLLVDPKSRNYKIETIAREAGFGSKVNFYSAFSSLTGSKPAIYRNNGL